MGLFDSARKVVRAVGRSIGVGGESKAAARMRHPTYGTTGEWGGRGPVTIYYAGQPANPDYDYAAEVADVWLNGAVGACLGWISDNFTQPELQVVKKKVERSKVKGRKPITLYEPIDDHDLVQLIDEPNPEYDADALWAATVLSFVVSGNAYWIKAKAPAGSKMYLWYVPHFEIRPIWGRSGTSFIDHYEHCVDGQRFRIEKEDVVHFRRGLNPSNVRSGLPQLDPVIKDIATDNAGSAYSAAVLRNYGVGSVVISPARPEDTITEQDAKTLVQLFQERTTGENRGRPIVAYGGIRLDKLSHSPEELALDKMRTFPEDRICSAMRISPMVVGLTSGSVHKTYANYGESLSAAWDNCMVPMQRRFAKALTKHLLPDLGGITGKEFVQWDYSAVPAMADDEDAKAKRVALLFEKKIIKRGKACDILNMECPPDDDVYFGEPSIGQEPVVPPALRPFAQGGNGNGDGQLALGPDGQPIDPNAPADQTPLRKPPPRIAKALEAAERAKAKAAAHNGHQGGPAATDAATGLLEAEDGNSDDNSDDALASLEAELSGAGVESKDVFSSASFPPANAYRTLRRIREHARRRLKGEAEAFLAAYGTKPKLKADESGISQKAALAEHLSADVRGWFAGIKGLLTSLYRAAAAALLGGEVRQGDPESMDLAKAEAVQLEYLSGFEAATLDGSQSLDGTFANRAELYGAATWGVAQDVVRAKAIRDGMLYERRVHGGPDLPCDTCSEQQGVGWQPINTLKSIGDSPCQSNCHCAFAFSQSAGGES
jgi:HK97 family phage portal protein